MQSKIHEPAEITLKMHGRTYSVTGLDWDSTANDLLDEFKGLLVAGGFPPSVMNDEWGGWEYKEYDTKKED